MIEMIANTTDIRKKKKIETNFYFRSLKLDLLSSIFQVLVLNSNSKKNLEYWRIVEIFGQSQIVANFDYLRIIGGSNLECRSTNRDDKQIIVDTLADLISSNFGRFNALHSINRIQLKKNLQVFAISRKQSDNRLFMTYRE